MVLTPVHLHLVSDSTGDTVHALARACLVQFEDCEPIEHIWSMIRTKAQIERLIAAIEANPGVVLFSLVNETLRVPLVEGCRRLNLPAIPVLDPTIAALAGFLGRRPRGLPGQQHLLDQDYFARIDAMTFAMTHDDGQAPWGWNEADVVLIGVSRTSKTPTCIYLANRGIKAANMPLVPGIEQTVDFSQLTKPLIVGLTTDPDRLIAIRRNRINQLHAQQDVFDYIDQAAVAAEVAQARRLFAEHRWPVIDVTRRSIEETAAAILQLLAKRHAAHA